MPPRPARPPPPGRPPGPPPKPGLPLGPPPGRPAPAGAPGRPPGLGRPLLTPGPPGPPGPRLLTQGALCLGIIAGLGRGMPGRGAGRGPPARSLPSRATGGRGGIPVPGAAAAPGAGPVPEAVPGRPGRCMPCVLENGLLPGRTEPPRALGRGDGRGPGRAGADCAEAAGASGASGGGADRSDGGGCVGTCACSTPLPGTGEGGTAPAGTGRTGASDAGAGAVGAGASLVAAVDGAPCSRSLSPNDSFRRRTTGASTVEEADLTNSPMSLRVARMTLLSTPSSLASSWTRTLATVLLLGPTPSGAPDR
ncbi:hypothetical protein BH24ACT12_BH24ACT12_04890 [soil metagenome]